MNRSVRLAYLQRLLYRNPQGYRPSELADLCEVDQRTVNRDLEDLCAEPFRIPLIMEGWRWRGDLAPPDLCHEIAEEVRKAAALYQGAE